MGRAREKRTIISIGHMDVHPLEVARFLAGIIIKSVCRQYATLKFRESSRNRADRQTQLKLNPVIES